MVNTITRMETTGQCFIGEWFLMNHIPNPWFALASNKVYSSTELRQIRLRREGDDEQGLFLLSVNDELNISFINSWIIAGGLPHNAYFVDWYDQIGMYSPARVTQQTPANQPKYVPDAINNKIGFESVIPSVVEVNLTGVVSPDKTSPATMFFVVNVAGDQGISGASFFATNETLDNDTFKTTFINTTFLIQGRDNAGSAFNTPSILNATGIKLWTFVFDGVDNIKVYVDDEPAGIDYNVAGGFTNTMKKLLLGNFGGTMTDCRIFDTVLSDGQRQTVKDDLNNRFAIY